MILDPSFALSASYNYSGDVGFLFFGFFFFGFFFPELAPSHLLSVSLAILVLLVAFN
jgi:hypothetical protein